MDFDAVKKLATLPTRSVALCLAGDLVEEIAQLERQLEAAKPGESLGDANPKRVIAEQIVAVQEQMHEATVQFHLRALPARAWGQLWAKWPVKADGEADEVWEERVFPCYLELISRTCQDPVMSVEQVDELTEMLHSAALSRLVGACISLNRGDVDVPNSAAASALTQDSEPT